MFACLHTRAMMAAQCGRMWVHGRHVAARVVQTVDVMHVMSFLVRIAAPIGAALGGKYVVLLVPQESHAPTDLHFAHAWPDGQGQHWHQYRT